MNLFDFFTLKVDPKDVEKSKQELFSGYNNDYKAWDPTGISPNIERLKEINAKNQAKYLFLQKNPKYPKKTMWSVFLMSLVVALILFYIADIIPYLGDIFYILGIIILFLPSFGFYFGLVGLGKDLIKLQIANENHWLYEPERDKELWNRYSKLYPEIFRKGEKKQYLEDLFWGAVNKNGYWNYFVSGLFNYTITTRDSKGRRKDTELTNHFFAIKLPKKLKSRFFIYPENGLSKIRNFFSKKEINTESTKFNKTFAFSYNGDKGDKALEIVKTLSPRVQEELLKLNDSKIKSTKAMGNPLAKGISVLFTDDVMIFSSFGPLIPIMKTDFLFRSVKIDQRDKEFISNELNTLIHISTEIVKYLD
jgi:hypothetical protein